MKICHKFILFALALTISLFLSVDLLAQEGGDQEIRRIIAEMEARLLVPCEPLETMMGDMINLGAAYQKKEGDRAATYKGVRQKYAEMVGAFVVASDKEGKAPVGKFMEAFTKLKERAAAQGILADGVRPGGATIAAVRNQQTAKRYFYFEEPESPAAQNKLSLRYKAEEDYEKLIAQWKEAREKLYKQFEAGGIFAGYDDDLRRIAATMAADSRQYGEKKKAMTALAATNEYEHCLGKLTIKNYTLQSDNPLQLYMKQEKGTEGAIPGMGFNLMTPAPYPALVKPDIGEFPLALHLKFNGADYLKMEKELLEIKLKAEEEATLAVALGMGKTGAFLFGVTYKTAEGLAAPVQLVYDIFRRPVDTVQNVSKLVGYVANTPILKLRDDGTLNPWVGAEKLYNAGVEAATKLALAGFTASENMYDPGRFDAKPGETVEQSIDRLQGQYDSVLKVKAGAEVAETLVAVIVQVVLDAGAGKGLDYAGDVIKYLKDGKKVAETLRKADAIASLKKVDALASVPDDVQKAAKTVKDIVEEQNKRIEELKNFLNGKKPAPPPGKALASAEQKDPLIFKDKDNVQISIPVGKQLGRGQTSDVWLNGADDSTVVRVTSLTTKASERAHFLDEFGRKAVDDVNSPIIRTAKRQKEMTLSNVDNRKQHVEIVEKVKPAKDWLEEQGGNLTKGQKLALEQGTRDLNAKGLAWVDNHTGNYAFEKLPGQDRWGVVVFDPGGIYPMKGANPAEMANNARALQNAISEAEKTARAEGIGDPRFYGGFIQASMRKVADDPAKGIDLAKVNLTKTTEIGMAAGPGKRPDCGDIYKKTADDVSRELDDHVNNTIAKDPAFQDLQGKIKAGNVSLDKATADLNKLTDQAQKKLDEVDPESVKKRNPVAPVPDKPDVVDAKIIAAPLVQDVALAIQQEACAGYRRALLSGTADEIIIAAYKECVKRGW